MREQSSTRFKICVPSYNSVPWIAKTLESIENQTYRNVDVCVIDDASSNPKQVEIIEDFCKRNGWQSIYNKENMGTLHNLLQGFRELECQDDDVCISLDGDDWLFNQYVLEEVNETYMTKRVLMCCGQPLTWKSQLIPKDGILPPWWVRLRRTYRKWWWFPFGQLRSFKYLLWRNIRDEDLRDSTGKYYKVTSDMAFIYPMAEMAGKRLHFESRIQYVANDSNPINDVKIRKAEQEAIARLIRRQRKYPVLSTL